MKEIRIGSIRNEIEIHLKLSSTNGKGIYLANRMQEHLSATNNPSKLLKIIKTCLKLGMPTYDEKHDALLFQNSKCDLLIYRNGCPKKWHLVRAHFKFKQF